jgi:hypothetical protein
VITACTPPAISISANNPRKIIQRTRFLKNPFSNKLFADCFVVIKSTGKKIVEKQNQHNNTPVIKNPEKLIDYIAFFINIKEEDYITYVDDHCFEYTKQFNDFIQQLHDSNMVDSYEHLIHSITDHPGDEQSRCEAFSGWMQELNRTISRPCDLREADVCFLRKAFLTLVRMEKIFPGSYAIDVETGTWLKLLKQFRNLYDAGRVKSKF